MHHYENHNDENDHDHKNNNIYIENQLITMNMKMMTIKRTTKRKEEVFPRRRTHENHRRRRPHGGSRRVTRPWHETHQDQKTTRGSTKRSPTRRGSEPTEAQRAPTAEGRETDHPRKDASPERAPRGSRTGRYHDEESRRRECSNELTC